jgi:hypothetical protein
MERKEHWIDQTLATEKFIQSVEPSNELMMRLKNIPNTISESYDKIPKKVVWAVAASIAILVCMNFISLKEYKQSSSSSIETTELLDSHFSYLKQL